MIKNNSSGMTLIEIVIALAILGVVAVGVLSMFTSGITFIAKAGNRSVATFDVQSQVEQILNQKNTNASEIVIRYHDGSPIPVPGRMTSESHTENGTTVNVYFFQPTH